ncbi:MAG: hypothetical protein HYZ47_01660 [Simkania negevensis]|nr:hypothetical protein [Simkania negevensis]
MSIRGISCRATLASFAFVNRSNSKVVRWFSSFSSYENLLKTSEREKVQAIVSHFLPKEVQSEFFSKDPEVTPKELLQLLKEVEKTTKAPIKKLDERVRKEDGIFFQNNRTFINLPYGKKTSTWSDRQALQMLIRGRFETLFQNGDLVLIPGCADGQIPIEIYAHSIKHNLKLDILAADYNDTAMKVGYFTMKSFGLNGDAISWLMTDISSESFFDWISQKHAHNMRHRVITLIQPSLREHTLLSFLKKNAELSYKTKSSNTVVMPVLLEDPSSKWYQLCDNHVKESLKLSEKSKDLPAFMWDRTKYGHEMLRLSSNRESYVPQQYFIAEKALSQLREEAGYIDESDKIFPPTSQTKKIEDERVIRSDISKRILCVWTVKK